MATERGSAVMTESVTDVLLARAGRRQSMTPMVVASAAAHVAVFVVLALMSLNASSAPAPKVFTVSLVGSEGPDTGGANPMGGRPIEQVAPADPKPVDKPPDVTPPKMVLPEPKPPKPRRPETTTARADTPAVKPPVAGGDEVRTGSTKIDTGVRGTGFGLKSGGGAGGPVTLEVSDFCCKEYIEQVTARINEAWRREQGSLGTVVVKFTIRRDGSVDTPNVGIERSSGYQNLDFEAKRAVQIARLPALPAQFHDEVLVVRLTLNYER
jgi:TonB family protein